MSTYLGEAYLMAGRLADGADSAQRALTLARHQHQRGTQAWMLRLLGEIAAHENPPDAAGAEEFYRQALVLAEELGMRPSPRVAISGSAGFTAKRDRALRPRSI